MRRSKAQFHELRAASQNSPFLRRLRDLSRLLPNHPVKRHNRTMARITELEINGTRRHLDADPDRTLLSVLRDDLALTGAKFGCGEGLCGACTVIVENEAVRSCVTPLKAVAGKRVLTIEGIGQNGLHAVQRAFLDHHAFQCGYCTPGMILNAYALLLKTPHPTRQQIADHMEDNLCRCGAHPRILAAIEEAAAAKEGA